MDVLYARWQPKRRMCFTGLPVCAIRIQAVIEDLCTSSPQEYAVMLALILVLVAGGYFRWLFPRFAATGHS